MKAARDLDVVVIGAGMAGLAAARTLAEAGLQVTLVEAETRVGGRILTLRDGDAIIELGAEFVHGRPPQLLALIEEAGLELYERTGDFLRLEDGSLHAQEDGETQDEDPLERLKEYCGADRSFSSYLDQIGLKGDASAEAIAYVEGFNAADADEASVLALGRQQAAEDAIEGDRLWRVNDGYDTLPAFLAERFQAAGGRLVLGARVTVVKWQHGQVMVSTDNENFVAKRAVVTLPLGVLQAGKVKFEPAPGPVLEAVSALRMGNVCRFTLLFRQKVWPDKMSFLLTRELLPSVWWTAHPTSANSLTGWVGGPRSAMLDGMDAAELAHRGCAGLALAFGLDEAELGTNLAGAYMHDWKADESSLGSYSWIPAGSMHLPARMSEPVDGTLFFAGEHTDVTGHWGTVHAAFGSGLRAAQQILNDLIDR